MAGYGDVDAIIMASGFSRRFGNTDKLLYHIKGKPLAAYTLELMCDMPELKTVFFVCASDETAKLAANYPVRIIRNERPGRGQCESIRLGVSASAAKHYLFLPCDQPFLDKTTVLSIIALREPGCIVVPTHKGAPGMPTLFSSAFRTELLALRDGQNARIIRDSHPAALRTISIESPKPLYDIDSEEDLKRFINAPDIN